MAKKFYDTSKAASVIVNVIKWTTFAILTLYCISLIYPLVWMLMNAFKDEYRYAMNLFGFPDIWKFSNFSDVLKFMKVPVRVEGGGMVHYGIGYMAIFSFLRSFFIPLITVAFQAGCAYCLAKYKFVGDRLIFAVGIFIMIMPVVNNLPSAMLINKALGVYDNIFLNIITSPGATFSGLHFLILYGAFKSISWEYAEAAFIDGAGSYGVMIKIMMPMVLPTCAVLFVLNFISIWNDYQTALIWLPSFPNLAYGLYYFQMTSSGGAEGVSTPMILAGFSLVMIPSAVLFLSSQKLIMSKFNVGGLKA